MEAKFLDDNKLKLLLNSEFGLFQTSLISFNFLSKVSEIFLGLNPKRPYLSFEKENFCHVFTYFINPASEIRIMFHVAVVQRRLRNEQKSMMHGLEVVSLRIAYAQCAWLPCMGLR